jgi:hypothetical protein
MIRVVALLFAALTVAPAASAQMRGMAACCTGTPIELKGKVERVQITPGEGMPFIRIKTSEKPVTVFLGPMRWVMRFMMASGFNPRQDDEIVVKAYPMNGNYVAAVLTLSGGKTLRLRDDSGRPLWGGRPW